MPLLTINHIFMMCAGPEAFTSTTIFKKCGGKLALEAGMLHPENPSGALLFNDIEIGNDFIENVMIFLSNCKQHKQVLWSIGLGLCTLHSFKYNDY